MKSAIRNAWLRPAPNAPPDRQVLVGDRFRIEDRQETWVKGVTDKDNYPGWLPENALAPAIAPTHWIAVRTTWGFAAPDIKSEPLIDLHMTSELEARDKEGGWLEATFGDRTVFIPKEHCRAMAARMRDPVAAARAFLDTPYVWAGNTGFGLDCSGLVQAALRATGIPCPADSGDQERMSGDHLTETDPHLPGDLIFWTGHVAMATGPDTIIHANAHHMKVVEEPRNQAESRIAASATGPVTSRLRPSKPGQFE